MSSYRWRLELSREVAQWISGLEVKERAQAARAFEQLQELGPWIRMPRSKALGDGLFELRFLCGGVQRRITYTFHADRSILMLTTFRKQRQRETSEITRARNVLRQSKREGS